MEKSWNKKFRNALTGIAKGMHDQNSFHVHIPVAAAVIGLAFFLHLEWIRICVLLLCITLVIACELFNSSVERLAKSITKEHDQNVGDALDIASGAVLVVAIGAAIVGLIILLPPIVTRFF